MSGEPGDNRHFEGAREPRASDTDLIRESPSAAPVQQALVLRTSYGVSQAGRSMQYEHTGGMLVTRDGNRDGKRVGILTERDFLPRIEDRCSGPATPPMTMREGA
jgi:hypothetical protein